MKHRPWLARHTPRVREVEPPPRPLLWRIGRALRNVLIIVFIVLAVQLLAILVGCNSFGAIVDRDLAPSLPSDLAASIDAASAGVENYARAEEQTYLTLPEWYIVYSTDEYAAFLQENAPSRFPYFRAVGQYWSSYRDVCLLTRERYDFNRRYHTILYVIGISFSFENFSKGFYENTVGRLTEWLSTPELTEEDVFARAVAKEYGEFLHTIPWFEFPFGERRQQLWETTAREGPNPIRKWERKFFLSMEYGAKAAYGAVIRSGNEASFETQDLATVAAVQGMTNALLATEPDVQLLAPIDGDTSLVSLPRYEAFTQLVPQLVRQGVRFVEIAGNNEIMVTIWAPRDWTYDLAVGTMLFSMPILTQPDLQRLVVRAPVVELHQLLLALDEHNLQLEHIYDY